MNYSDSEKHFIQKYENSFMDEAYKLYIYIYIFLINFILNIIIIIIIINIIIIMPFSYNLMMINISLLLYYTTYTTTYITQKQQQTKQNCFTLRAQNLFYIIRKYFNFCPKS
jgi:hypothetical protein